MKFLPEEIVVQILSSLRVRSLFRFRCVSKAWHALILSHPKLLGQRSVLAHEIYQKPDDDQASYGLLQLLGSCNGIFLIRVDEDFFLWNPSNKYSRKVLHYSTWFPLGHREIMLSGLCYDSSKDDYTILVAVKRHFGLFPIADYYSLKRKHWRQTPYKHNTFASRLGSPVNGCLYWLAIEDEHCCICCFDPSMDRISELAKPKLDKTEEIVGLGAIRESLLSLTVLDHRNDLIKVLAMVKSNGQGSWPTLFLIPSRKLRGVNMSCSSPLKLCFLKDGEFLMLTNNSQLLALEPTTGFLRVVSKAISRDGQQLNAVTYMETLASTSGHDFDAEEGLIGPNIQNLIPHLIVSY